MGVSISRRGNAHRSGGGRWPPRPCVRRPWVWRNWMARPDKVEQVKLLSEKLQSAKTAVLTDYRGLTVSQLEDLRARFRGANVEYRVIKNTLARRAVSDSGHDAA